MLYEVVVTLFVTLFLFVSMLVASFATMWGEKPASAREIQFALIFSAFTASLLMVLGVALEVEPFVA
jgi:uncharacterized BrkB/YihY/UPF0761 family membrane protein